jgi:16S rRNA A1518/A1519 N6-dimethyltransferase RsmA/KsgA/DIM1 with predicted DNA glycosylase/AP lyase activity
MVNDIVYRNDTVLDIGPGQGLFTISLLQHSFSGE